MSDECTYCLDRTRQGGIFDINCPACRAALAISEPCRLARDEMVKDMIKRFGPVDNWQHTHCECKKVCARKQMQRRAGVPE
jgi:hypothetical protein